MWSGFALRSELDLHRAPACAEDIKKEISTLKAVSRKNPRLEPYFTFKISVLSVQRANTLVLMSRLSQEIQNIKNDSYLNDARREVNGQIGDICKIVGEDIDAGLTDNQEAMATIVEFKPIQRLHLLQGFKQCLEAIKGSMGQTSKWRWSFPDAHLKLTTLARNLLDFKQFDRTKDPNDENYRPLQEYMRFLQEESHLAAEEFRQKYELSTKDVSDLQRLQRIFEFQKRLFTFTGQRDELDRVLARLDNVKEMVESLIGDKGDKKGKKKK